MTSGIQIFLLLLLFLNCLCFSLRLQLKSSWRNLHRWCIMTNIRSKNPFSMPLQLQSVAETGFFPSADSCGMAGANSISVGLSTAWQPWLFCPRQVKQVTAPARSWAPQHCQLLLSSCSLGLASPLALLPWDCAKNIPVSFRISVCILGCRGRSSAHFYVFLSTLCQPNSPHCWVSFLPIPFTFLALQQLSSSKHSQNIFQQPFLCCYCLAIHQWEMTNNFNKELSKPYLKERSKW